MSNTKRPSLDRKVTPKSEANRRNKHDEQRVSIRVDGVVYTVSPSDLTGRDEARIRRETGHSLSHLVDTLHTDPGVDVLGAFMWVALLQAGEDADYGEVLDSISYASEVETAKPEDGEPHPEA